MPPTGTTAEPLQHRLREIALETRSTYVNVLAGRGEYPWWDVVGLTASSNQQARMLSEELRRRREAGNIPGQAKFLVFADTPGRRMGTGGATLNALDGWPARSMPNWTTPGGVRTGCW